MSARLIKETRDLLPVFAGTLPLIVVTQLLWPPAGFSYLALGVACLAMAGSSFGNEFQHRTLSLLLSQPIARSVIWREKMLVLGTGMVTSLIALLVSLVVSGAIPARVDWLTLGLIPLCAFCGTPFWTLLLRHGIGGMVFAVGAPCGILVVYAVVVEQLGGNEPDALVTAVLSLLFIYCAVVYWLGYAKFKRLEAVDSPSRNLSLPAGLEAIFVLPLTRISSRFRGPFATLLKKEFRLQHTSFLLAGLFFLVAVAGFCLTRAYPRVAEGIIGVDYIIFMLVLPFMAGAIAVADEKGWEIMPWHLTLPPSALQQWSAKMLAALSTGLGLGLVLPFAMAVADSLLLGQVGPKTALPSVPVITCWLLGALLATSLAVYAASFSSNSLRAILMAMGLVAAGGVVCWLAGSCAAHIEARWMVLRMYAAQDAMRQAPKLVAIGLLLVLCVAQALAWSNFRRSAAPALEVVGQIAVLLLCAGFYTLIAVLATLGSRFFLG